MLPKSVQGGTVLQLDHPTLRVFQDRVFSWNPYKNFLPIFYLIEAIRAVGRVLAVAADDDTHLDNIQALDNALASWEHRLPPIYADVIAPFEEVDLMLFEARWFILCTTIFLYFSAKRPPRHRSLHERHCFWESSHDTCAPVQTRLPTAT